MNCLKHISFRIYLLSFLLAGVLSLSAQDNDTRTVSGTVQSAAGEFLPGVNVIVQGSTIGTVTNLDGQFTLDIPSNTTLLEFSMMGFVSQQIEAQGKSIFTITLGSDLVALSEVVILGYGQQKKEDVTGSVSSISRKDFDLQPTTGVEQILQGRTAGVEVSNTSGAPGGDVKIRIRGANSIIGNNNPLVVIDGVIGANFSSVSSNDILSIEVLKDASSTAIFGSRGANGVVIVTTKSGSEGKPTVSFNTFHGLSHLPKKIDYLEAGEFAELYNIYDETIRRVPGFPFTPAFSDDEIADFKNNGGTDWQDELFRTGNTHSYEIALKGGSENSKYYVSGEYLEQKGIVINSDYKRFALRSKLESDINEKIKVNVNLAANHQNGHNNNDIGSQFSPIGRMPQWVATESVKDENGEFYNYSPKHGAVTGNPVGLQMTQNNNNITNTFLPSGFINYQILPSLSVKASGAIEVRERTNTYFNDNELLLGPSGSSNSGINNHQSYRTQYSIVANYSKEIAKHTFGITGIFEETSFKEEGSYANAINLNSSIYEHYNLALSASQTASSYYYDEYLRSQAGRLNYSYDGKYLVTATVRRDGSSKFKDDNQFGIFPSTAIGWRVSEESFMKSVEVISNLKVRVSYGITGSQAVGSYATLPYFVQNSSTDYAVNGPTGANSTGLGVGSPGNPALKWESTKQSNIGFELGLLDGRISVEGDVYKKNTEDLLLNYQLPYYSGNASIIRNIGEVSNKGFEFSTTATAISKPNVNLRIGFNISLNRNMVEDLGEESQIFPGSKYADASSTLTIIKEGEQLGTFYGYEYLGVWKSHEAAEASKYGNKPGDAKYADLNNDNNINSEDLGIIGYAQPDFNYGINNTLSLWDFDINLFFQGVKGGQIFNGMEQKSYGLFGQSKAFTHPGYHNRWTPENEDTDVPAFSGTSALYSGSSRWLEDRSYFRLKNATIAYNVPEDVLKKINISKLNIYVSGTNLFTLTSYNGYDPEVSTAGNTQGGGAATDVDQNIDTGAYPNARTYTMGLKVTF